MDKVHTRETKLFSRLVAKEGVDVKAALVVATGIHQCTLLYDGFADRLASEGYPTLLYDHRGFGQSPRYNEGPGCKGGGMFSRSQIAHWDSRDKPSAARDLKEMALLAKELTGASKVFIFGHSLGGLVAGLLGTSDDNPADGYILSNPSLQNPWDDAAQEKLKTMGPEVANLNFTVAVQQSASSNEEFLALWNSEAVAKHIEPERPFKAAYQLGACEAINVVRSRFNKWTSPALILKGNADVEVFEKGACADFITGATEAEGKLVLKEYGELDEETKKWTWGYHEIIFEKGLDMSPGKNVVVDDIVAWLEASLAPAA